LQVIKLQQRSLIKVPVLRKLMTEVQKPYLFWPQYHCSLAGFAVCRLQLETVIGNLKSVIITTSTHCMISHQSLQAG